MSNEYNHNRSNHKSCDAPKKPKFTPPPQIANKDIYVGIDYGSKDMSGKTIKETCEELSKQIDGIMIDLINSYYDKREKWLIENGVTKDNAHEYELITSNLNCYLRKDGKIISSFIVHK